MTIVRLDNSLASGLLLYDNVLHGTMGFAIRREKCRKARSNPRQFHVWLVEFLQGRQININRAQQGCKDSRRFQRRIGKDVANRQCLRGFSHGLARFLHRSILEALQCRQNPCKSLRIHGLSGLPATRCALPEMILRSALSALFPRFAEYYFTFCLATRPGPTPRRCWS